MADPRETLTVVVGGTPVQVEANPNAELRTVVNRALAESHNTGQPPENWELRDKDGNLLDVTKKVSAYHFAAGATLFLNLRAGIGG